MIEARELRIGNFFIEENSGEIIKVIGLEEKRIVFSGMFLDKWQSKPIPLTEEILLKCGFTERYDEVFFIATGYVEIIYLKGELYLSIEGQLLPLQCEHLHQLQNLYFALTGEELEVKL